MERLKKEKPKKVRVLITIDQELYIKYGLYIENLSSYLNACLRNKIDLEENKLFDNGSDNISLCKIGQKRKSPQYDDSELLEIAHTKWINTSE